MKKSIVLLASVAAFALASCGNKTSEAPTSGDTIPATELVPATTVPEEAVAVTEVIDQALKGETPDAEKVEEAMKEATEAIKKLEEEGKTEEAAAYASKVKAFVNENAEAIKKLSPETATVLDMLNAATNLPEAVKQTAEEGAEAVKSDAAAAKEAAKEAGEKVAEKAKADAQAAGEKAKADAQAAVDAKKEEAREDAHKALDKGLNKLLGK